MRTVRETKRVRPPPQRGARRWPSPATPTPASPACSTGSPAPGVLVEDALFATLDPTTRRATHRGRAGLHALRHGRLRPAPAAPARRGVPLDAGGGRRGRPGRARGRRRPPRPGGAGPRGARGARRGRRRPAARAAGGQQDRRGRRGDAAAAQAALAGRGLRLGAHRARASTSCARRSRRGCRGRRSSCACCVPYDRGDLVARVHRTGEVLQHRAHRRRAPQLQVRVGRGARGRAGAVRRVTEVTCGRADAVGDASTASPRRKRRHATLVRCGVSRCSVVAVAVGARRCSAPRRGARRRRRSPAPPPAAPAPAADAGQEASARSPTSALTELSGLVATKSGYVVDQRRHRRSRRASGSSSSTASARSSKQPVTLPRQRPARPGGPGARPGRQTSGSPTSATTTPGASAATRRAVEDAGRRQGQPALLPAVLPGRQAARRRGAAASAATARRSSSPRRPASRPSIYAPTGAAGDGQHRRRADEEGRRVHACRRPTRTTRSASLGRTLVTGAAKSPDGTKVVLRTYADAFECDVDRTATSSRRSPAASRGSPRCPTSRSARRSPTAPTARLPHRLRRRAGSTTTTPIDILSYTPSTSTPAPPAAGRTAPSRPAGESWFDELSLDEHHVPDRRPSAWSALLLVGRRHLRHPSRPQAPRAATDDDATTTATTTSRRRRRPRAGARSARPAAAYRSAATTARAGGAGYGAGRGHAAGTARRALRRRPATARGQRLRRRTAAGGGAGRGVRRRPAAAAYGGAGRHAGGYGGRQQRLRRAGGGQQRLRRPVRRPAGLRRLRRSAAVTADPAGTAAAGYRGQQHGRRATTTARASRTAQYGSRGYGRVDRGDRYDRQLRRRAARR